MERQTLVTLLLSVFIALLGIGIIIPIMPVFATKLGASGFALGMIIAAFSVSRGLLQPVIGSLSDKFGRKWFLVAGLCIYGAVGLLIPHAHSVIDLIIIRGFHGVGSAMIVPIAMAYMSFLAPEGQEGRYMGYLNIAIFCGIGCGPVFGGFFNDHWGMASAFNAMAALSFFSFVLVMYKMPAHVPARDKGRRGLVKSMVAMVQRRRTAGILAARYATMIMMVPTMAFLPLLMSNWEGVTGLQIGIVIASRTLVNALLQVPFGKLADRRSKLVLLLSGTTLMCLAMILVPQVETVTRMMLLYMLLGVGEAIIWPVLGAYASEEGRKHFGHGTMMGVFSLAMSAGVFTGAMLSGYTMDHLGIASAYYFTAGAIVLLTSGSALLIHSGNSRDRRDAAAAAA
ncbi:MFS transporter [Desulfopila aestuarii]|uniref:Predicted arabinose efflux permease, MFS family n=1 Tax=Desulfopila aestuarii DSM 18488 TaxID=1121416 RepID=A0A1M7Y4I1_9BACT|nr:MFS transporter [Desulfopila aestuarii]SHO47148.1 Predicted arabinose efflux permease, MFS family [Desulfopila aestuarii DSM 18488]